MFFCKKKIQEGKEVVGYPPREDMAERIKQLETELDQYKGWWTEAKNEQRDAESVIDWKGLNAVTIERSPNGNHPNTIIGFKKVTSTVNADGNSSTETVIKEWYLHCSQKRHDELVVQFKEYLNKK